MATVNLASRYSEKVDERWDRVSLAKEVSGANYDFSGVQSVNVFSYGTAPLNDYTRSGDKRYGTAEVLGNAVQELKITQDKAFTYTIDRLDRDETMMTQDAGRSLDYEIRQVIVPEYDKYVFTKLAIVACAEVGQNSVTAAATKGTAYEELLKGQEVLGNNNVPDVGRIAICSYTFANFLKQDPAFMRYGDESQKMLIKGYLGEVDGTRIMKAPASRLPDGCDFILLHPDACCAPEKLVDYKVHQDPPGISGWLVEGRVVYDAFVLDQKKNGVYYKGSKTVPTV